MQLSNLCSNEILLLGGGLEGHALRQREMRESQGRGPHWRKVNVVVMTVDQGKIYGGLL